MPDSGNTGYCRIYAGRKRRYQYLSYSPHEKHHGSQIQTGVIDSQYPTGFGIGEGKVFFQQEQQEKKHHAQQKIMGMDNGECSFGGKIVTFSELAIEHAANHRKDGVQQCRMNVIEASFVPAV